MYSASLLGSSCVTYLIFDDLEFYEMKCIHCNSEVADGMRFCPYCGNPMAFQQQPEQWQFQHQNNTHHTVPSKYILFAGAGLLLFFVLITCDGCELDEGSDYDQSSSPSAKEEQIDLSLIDRYELELRIEIKYDLENVKVTKIEKISNSPLKIKFHFDYDSVLERMRNITGVCTYYDDGEIDEVHVNMTLVPSRFH